MSPVILNLLGLWAICLNGANRPELYLSYFTAHERVEAYVLLSGDSCTPQARNFKAALVTRWSYQLHGEEIQQTLLSEHAAFFDPVTAEQQGVDVVCGKDDWMSFEAGCLRDLDELKEYEKTREKVSFKTAKSTLTEQLIRLR